MLRAVAKNHSWDGGDVERIRVAGWRFYYSARRNLRIKGKRLQRNRLPGGILATMAGDVRAAGLAFIAEMPCLEPNTRTAVRPTQGWRAEPSNLPDEIKAALDILDHVIYRLLERWGWHTINPDLDPGTGEEIPLRSTDCPVISEGDLTLIREALERLGNVEPEEKAWKQARPLPQTPEAAAGLSDSQRDADLTEAATIPPPAAPPSQPEPTGKPEARKRNRGLAAQCKGIYTGYLERNEEPPTGAQIAAIVGCDPATVSRAIGPLERRRKALAREAARDRQRRRDRRNGIA